MTDLRIIELFFARDESAIRESNTKYGSYCHSAAKRVLGDDLDAEECVNDTWLAAWNRIPPEKPSDLCAFLSRIAHNIAVDRLRKRTAAKRGGGESALILDELDECIEGSAGADTELLNKELSAAVNGFIKRLPKRDREMFIARYSMSYEISEISGAFGYGENYVRAVLSATRKKLKEYLNKEGLL